MGMIEDITKLMRKGPELVSQLDAAKINTKSVVRGANDATFQFPCLIADSVPVDYATTLTQQFDKVYASFTQTWISLHPFMDISLDPTPISYLQRLHQNMKLESTEFSDSGEELEKCMQEAYNGEALLYMNESKDFGVLFTGCDKPTHEMLKSNREYMREYMSDFNLLPVVTEADSDGTNAYDLANSLLDNKIRQVDSEKRDNVLRQSDRNRAPQLLDRDVKKSNDMLPYGIQVRLIAKNEKNEFVQYIDFVIGVKAIMHSVKSDDMIDNIQRALQNKSLFFKFLRWTSGEISLVKNIILNLDEIKLDASNRNSGKSPFFGVLKRLKNKKIGVRNLTVPHALIPNATIVISSYEADYLLNNSGIDVRNASIAKKLLDALFLVAFVVVDDATSTIDILYDGSDSYQTYSIETLERENALRSNKLGREIGRMIAH